MDIGITQTQSVEARVPVDHASVELAQALPNDLQFSTWSPFNRVTFLSL